DRREACESTWAGELRRRGHIVLYAEGGHERPRAVNHVIQLPVADDYDSLSIKVREAIRFILGTIPIGQIDRLFIVDDNTFVHPDRWQAHQPDGEFEGLETDKIPWAHGGAGWWMSRRCCELYVEGVEQACSWDDRL